MFTNVAWATDGSEHADRALAYAEGLISREGGTLHVIHIVEKLVGPRVAGLDAKLNEADLETKIAGQARAAERDGLHAELHMATGHGGEIFRRIADEAAAAGADVIVVGTRGHSAVVAAVIGSVTQGLLRVAGCPVLAVPPGCDGRRQPQPTADAGVTA